MIDVVVIGAGHSGLSISYLLKQNNISHLVLEKGEIGDSWVNQRWDSFKMVTPSKMNLLEGMDNVGIDDKHLTTSTEFSTLLKLYSKKKKLPVLENTVVKTLTRTDDGFFKIVTQSINVIKEIDAKLVVIASGGLNKKIVPDYSKNITDNIFQIHSCDYKNATQLKDGETLVVGCGQSGIQITKELLDSGKTVYLSTSEVGKLSRYYRDRDVLDWLVEMNFYDVTKDELEDITIIKNPQPQLSTDPNFPELNLHSVHKLGAKLLGSVYDASDNNILVKDNLESNIKYAESYWQTIKNKIDFYIDGNNVKANVNCELSLINITRSSLDLTELNIKNIIWATGLTGNFEYIKINGFDITEDINESNGISKITGMYYLGFPWLRKRKSGIIYGIKEDAKIVFDKIKKTLVNV